MMAATLAYTLVAVILRSSYVCQCEDLTALTKPVSHGEGPHWDHVDNVLYYVDISGNSVHRYDPETKADLYLTLDKPVTLVLPIQGQRYKFVLGLGLELVVLTWDWESGFHDVSPIVSVEDSPAQRFNDGKADAKGRIWAGTMSEPEMNQGALYRVDNNPNVSCKAESMVSPVSISNGIIWSADNKIMYYIDTPTRKIDAFDFDLASGNIYNRRPVFQFGDLHGSPDGMTIDADGNLWIACWGGSQVIHVNPNTGKLLHQIKFPVERVTSPVFGGKYLDTLYVTSMHVGLSTEQLDAQPMAGTVWQVTGLNVTGTASKPAIVNCKCNQ